MVKFPKPLQSGDRIAIVSPAGIPDAEAVHAAAKILRQQGWDPYIAPHALGRSGSYAGTVEERYSDLADAFADPSVRAILCSRGGYGVVHLMQRLSQLPLADDPKWVIGFSDISALHALMNSKGVASVHGSMASHIKLGPDDPDNAMFFRIMRGERPNFTFPSSPLDRPGLADGILIGGNLAVLADLMGTDFDLIRPDTILFIEDVSEPVYKIERILYQMRLTGVLGRLRGLMVGQFTEYKGDANYKTMEDMIHAMVAPYSYPVAFNVPIGHVFHNVPVIEGARVTLKVTSTDNNHLIYWQ